MNFLINSLQYFLKFLPPEKYWVVGNYTMRQILHNAINLVVITVHIIDISLAYAKLYTVYGIPIATFYIKNM